MENEGKQSKGRRTDSGKRELGLYLHIPFCVKKCDYCDFLSSPATEESKKRYVDALIKEIASYQGRTEEYTVPTIFFGGGTPSTLNTGEIGRILEALDKVFQIDREAIEATIEVNPGTVTRDKLTEYKRAGINRLSFGLQSAVDSELKRLGRIHCYQDFVDNYHLARELGFQNINIDLMSALPGQKQETWETTLHTVVDLAPEHISAYSLMIEEGTNFYKIYGEGAPDEKELPDEETDRLLYIRTKEILKQYGYERYEISNYAKPGFECRHNNSYWTGTKYLGLGLGSASLIQNVRFTNEKDLTTYLTLCEQYSPGTVESEASLGIDYIGIRREITPLSIEQRMEEFMFLGLRRTEGVSRKEFLEHFAVPMEEIYGAILKQLEEKQLITLHEDRIRLSEYGIDISNYVLSEFLLD